MIKLSPASDMGQSRFASHQTDGHTLVCFSHLRWNFVFQRPQHLMSRFAEDRRGDLSETETALLSFLVANNKRAVSREELLTRVWGIEPQGLETRTIDMHIARLRTKLRDPSGKQTPEAIMTVRAHGYMAGPDLVPLESAATAT